MINKKRLISIQTFETALRLGLYNILRVLLYRLSLRIPFSKVRLSTSIIEPGIEFVPIKQESHILIHSNSELPKLFGWIDFTNEIQIPPNWHENPITHEKISHPFHDWWEIPDFESGAGDIKTIWEISRFGWSINLALSSFNGSQESLKTLNDWLNDWILNNKPYKGPNWKCGQETSIRLINLAMASLFVEVTEKSKPILSQFIETHLRRIELTSGYAISQKNNHSISEAAGLYIGGRWLSIIDPHKSFLANKCISLGFQRLETLSQRLIGPDGTFSQQSTNYHRMILSLYSMCDIWRRKFDGACFSDETYQRLIKAILWLYQITQKPSGYAPNLGGNDGTIIGNLAGHDYRDMRPVLQLSSALFMNRKAYEEDGDQNITLKLLGIPIPKEQIPSPESELFSYGNYVTLRNRDAFILFNLPQNRYRPSQCDPLHVDLWLNGKELLCDGGTYSYNFDSDYFKSMKAHNTIQFDDREPMPTLGKFLYQKWLNTKNLNFCPEKLISSAGYQDYKGAYHFREVRLSETYMKVIDVIDGFDKKAVLRWRTTEKNWELNDKTFTNGKYSIDITSETNIDNLYIENGWTSHYYMKKTPIDVICASVSKPTKFTTIYKFNQ